MSSSTFRVERLIHGGQRQESNTTSPTLTAIPRYPSLTTTVPKEFVHRASVAEVLLTDWDRVGDLGFTVTAQLPRHHGFFATIHDCHDPLMIAETIRQAGILLAHAEFAVPLGHQFLMWDLSVDIAPEHLLVGTTPAGLDIEITCTDVKRRGANLAGLHFDAVIRRDQQVAATGSATFTCASPAVYQRLRSASIGDGAPATLVLTSPVAPQDVGRVSPPTSSCPPRRRRTAGNCGSTPGTPSSSTTPSTTYPAWCFWRLPARPVRRSSGIRASPSASPANSPGTWSSTRVA